MSEYGLSVRSRNCRTFMNVSAVGVFFLTQQSFAGSREIFRVRGVRPLLSLLVYSSALARLLLSSDLLRGWSVLR